MTKNELEMMKCTNVPSQKMAMQTILKDVLQSKYEMNTNEFTSTLMLKALVSSSTKHQLATSAGSPTAINVW